MNGAEQTSPHAVELSCPTPVRRLLVGGDDGSELWLKDDSRISSVYGGNKPRKLAHLLRAALASNAKRLVTVGALGSHHVLATGLLGRSLGLKTTALAVARPYSIHAEQTTLRTLEADVEIIPVGSPLQWAGALLRLRRPGDFFIPPGGSNVLGCLGYLEAALELKAQIDAGLIPEPDAIVVALGSGGTAAGLLAGLNAIGIGAQLVAVPVLKLPLAHAYVRRLASSAFRRFHQAGSRTATSPRDSGELLRIDSRWLGRGYGYPTAAGELAIAEGAALGLSLESTYTGKAFACALALLRGLTDRGNVKHQNVLEPALRRGKRILFWSTFSGVPLAAAPNSHVTLSPALKRLLRAP